MSVSLLLQERYTHIRCAAIYFSFGQNDPILTLSQPLPHRLRLAGLRPALDRVEDLCPRSLHPTNWSRTLCGLLVVITLVVPALVTRVDPNIVGP